MTVYFLFPDIFNPFYDLDRVTIDSDFSLNPVPDCLTAFLAGHILGLVCLANRLAWLTATDAAIGYEV
jgi:hypothetical protein